MFGITRLVSFLLRRSWGWMFIGVLMVIGGVIWGLTSHQVTYQNEQKDATYHIAVGETSGNIYINADGSSDYFVAFKGDFDPPIAQSDIDNSNTLEFVARTDTSNLDPPLNANGTTIDSAHKIEKLVFFDKSGNVQKTFTTAEYLANPNGFNDNEWLKSIWLIIAGIVIAGVALVYSLKGKKVQTDTGFNIGAAGAQPYAQPSPYGGAYQNPGQYPQATPYPPQTPPAYGQYPQGAPYPPQTPPAYGQYPQGTPYPPQQPDYGQYPPQQPPRQ